MKAAYGKSVCAVWAPDGGQRASAPPPTRLGLKVLRNGVTSEVHFVEGNLTDYRQDKSGLDQNAARRRTYGPMKIKLQGGKPVSEAEILALERGLHCALCPSVRSFLKSNDGAKPQSNTFIVSPNNDSGVRRFIPTSEILEARSHVENLSAKAYPIAEDACGNFVFVDEGRSGAVYFWDHETAEVTEVARDFQAFLNMLEPLDATSVKLNEGQVKRVWVDPEFLARTKKP